MEVVSSRDGTGIALERDGVGPPVVLVGGAFSDRSTFSSLATLLASRATVVRYDRRGRGASGSFDRSGWRLERELDDLKAVLGSCGEPALVFGHSSGAVLALEACLEDAGAVDALVLYEPPYRTEGHERPDPAHFLAQLNASIEAGDAAGATRRFLLDALGLSVPVLAGIESGPAWPAMVASARTLPFDVALAGRGRIPLERLGSLRVPLLVAAGSMSAGSVSDAARSLATAAPDGVYLELQGAGHTPSGAVLEPLLVSMLERPARRR